MPSCINDGLVITGNLESAGEIEIGGRIEGDIKCRALDIREGATVKGSIRADSVSVSGALSGKIDARRVTLTDTAHVTGDIVHESINIEIGAHIDGHCRPTHGKAGVQEAARRRADGGDKAKAAGRQATAPG